MCGIAGYVDLHARRGREELAAIVRAMADTMPYRGPDDRGEWVSPDGRCALAHRRLAIIDTSSGGHQPFAGERSALTFNGEIYDYREHAQLLEARGRVLRTKSDTEVLHALLEDEGELAIERLDGQFAFGFWRMRERDLLLARDPFGEKPLYFAQGDGWFAFASELHALARVPGFDDGIDDDAIGEYLALQYVDAPRTIWRGASKLRPGHWLRLDAEGRVRIGRHFAFRPHGPVHTETPLPVLADELEAILLRLVRRRMIADVPLGAFLSGGVDSSTVTALMTKAIGGQVKTFSIGFENAADETEHLYARTTAEHLRTEHHERVLKLDVLPLLHRIGSVLDEPNGDSSCLPTWLVSQVAKEHVTVCLSGDGGDELFGGYGRYFAALQDEARGRDFDAGRTYYGSRMLVFLDEHLHELFGRVPARTADLLGSFRRRMSREPGSLLHRMRRHDAEHYLPGAVLPKVDRMSMQHSLEVRTPFLGREVAQFAEKLSVDACFANGQGKLVLKEVAQRYLPREWLDRRKMGFGVPTRTGWGKEGLLDDLRQLVLANDSRLADWIPRRGREAFVTRMKGPGFAFYQAWVLLVLELWLRARPARRAEHEATAAIELARRPLDVTLAAIPRPEDALLWRRLRDRDQPALVFCGEDVPRWLAALPPGSAVVAPEAVELAPHVRSIALDWCGVTAPDDDVLASLPEGQAVFLAHVRRAHPDVLGFLQLRRTPILHRVGDRWFALDGAAVDASASGTNGATGATGVARRRGLRASLADRWFGQMLANGHVRDLEHAGGFAYRAPVGPALRGSMRDAAARIVLFEDGAQLPQPSSTVRAVAAFGSGRHCLDGDWLYFAASDNSDPRANGRSYLAAVRGRRSAAARFFAGTRLGRVAFAVRERLGAALTRTTPTERELRFRGPFRHDGGVCWLASLALMRAPRKLLEQGWRIVPYEDGHPLPLGDALHDDVRQVGCGRYSVWQRDLYFSALDNSDPNTNGRAYTARLLPPQQALGPEADDTHFALGAVLLPPQRDDGAFERAFAAFAARPADRAPRLEPGGRVAFLIGGLFPGGSERQLCNLAMELDRRGLSVTILALCGPGGASSHYRELLRGSRVAVRAADRPDPSFGTAGELEALDAERLELLSALPAAFRAETFALFTHLAVLRPDVLHAALDLPNLAGGIAAHLAGVPRAVLSVRSSSPAHYPGQDRPWFRTWYRLLGASARVRLFANSRVCADDYRAWLGDGAPEFRVVYNGLDERTLGWPADEQVAAFRRALEIPDSAPVVVGVLRFSEEKRLPVFVDALAAASARVPGLYAILAGTGPLAAETEALVRAAGLGDRVRFAGLQRDIALVHRAADVVMLTSRIEGTPNALLEAQWFERPVVATRAGGCVEAVLDGETGVLCAIDDAAALGLAVAELAGDPERRKRFGRRGREFMRERFALGTMVEATLALYRGE